jgi:hypothetical protein
MRLVFVLLGAACTLSACEVTSPRPRVFDSLRVFSRPRFATAEECSAAQASGPIHCTQEATFCPDGRATLRLTETLLAAEYSIRRDTLTLGLAVNQDTPPEMFFTVKSDESAITALATNHTWSRDMSREAALAGVCN